MRVRRAIYAADHTSFALRPLYEHSLLDLLGLRTLFPAVGGPPGQAGKARALLPLRRMPPSDLLPRRGGQALRDGEQVLGLGAEQRATLGVKAPAHWRGLSKTWRLLPLRTAGGLVIAQEDAPFATMPGAAIATGCVDYVLPLEKVAAAIIALCMVPGAAAWLQPSERLVA